VWVESVPGEGSIFWVELPIGQEETNLKNG
jgi:signal transduction histidine kinase